MKIELSKIDHTYKLEGRAVPGVTSIIKEILGESWQVNPWYLERGRAVHACAAFIAQGKEFKFDERISEEVAALKKFFSEVKPEIIGSEIFVGSSLYRYCGTLDFSCKIGGKLVLIDYKHSLDPVRTVIQIGGYAQAYKETAGIEALLGYGVEIRSNGTYSMSDKIDIRSARNQFLAIRTAYGLKEKVGNLTSQKEKKENGNNRISFE